MVDFLNKDDAIHGDKIAFWFGKVNLFPGKPDTVRLGLNGEAIVLAPLKRAVPLTGGKLYSRLRCQSAVGHAQGMLS